MKRNYIFYSIILICGIALDQVVKLIAVLFLKPIDIYPIIKNVFQLHYTENTGAAFSILEGKTFILSIITAFVLVVIIYFLLTNKINGELAKYSLVFIVTGGIGNLIDRIFIGYVVDIFDFCLINFAIFNVADVFVTCGTVTLIIAFILKKGEIFVWKKS